MNTASELLKELAAQDTAERRGPCECLDEGRAGGCQRCGWEPEEQVYLGWIPAELWDRVLKATGWWA